jgi:hypothetical protein
MDVASRSGHRSAGNGSAHRARARPSTKVTGRVAPERDPGRLSEPSGASCRRAGRPAHCAPGHALGLSAVQARRWLRYQLPEPEEPPVAPLARSRASLRRSGNSLLRARQERAAPHRGWSLRDLTTPHRLGERADGCPNLSADIANRAGGLRDMIHRRRRSRC